MIYLVARNQRVSNWSIWGRSGRHSTKRSSQVEVKELVVVSWELPVESWDSLPVVSYIKGPAFDQKSNETREKVLRPKYELSWVTESLSCCFCCFCFSCSVKFGGLVGILVWLFCSYSRQALSLCRPHMLRSRGIKRLPQLAPQILRSGGLLTCCVELEVPSDEWRILADYDK